MTKPSRRLAKQRRCLSPDRSINLIINDLQLLDSAGLDTVRSIQEHFADIPLITISEQTDQSVVRENIRLGTQDGLPKKELDPTHLNRTIVHTVERHHLHQRLRASMRHHDIVGRLSGDEFGVIAINAVTKSRPQILESISDWFAGFNANTTEPYHFHFNIGATYYNGSEKKGADELMERADQDLYTAKRKAHSKLYLPYG